jgi:hypothetical protein
VPKKEGRFQGLFGGEKANVDAVSAGGQSRHLCAHTTQKVFEHSHHLCAHTTEIVFGVNTAIEYALTQPKAFLG